MKHCTRCNQDKPDSEMLKRVSMCKECNNKYHRERTAQRNKNLGYGYGNEFNKLLTQKLVN